MRSIFFTISVVWITKLSMALKFCANKHYACVDDAEAICAASGANYCTNVMNGVTWKYSVDGVNGCHKFQSGGGNSSVEDKSCHNIGNRDVPGGAANCFPLHRNYCECKACTNHTDCAGITDGNGNAAGCEDAVNMTNTSYFRGFAAGKQCGIDNCANALKAAYGQLNTCE